MQPEIVIREIEKRRYANPVEADMEAVERLLKEVERRSRNLVRELGMLDAENAEAAEMLRTEIQALGRQKQQLKAEREEILPRQEAWAAAQARLDRLEEWCKSVATNSQTLRYDEKRDILLALGVEVKIYRKDHEPRYVINASIPDEEATVLPQRSSFS